MATRGAPARPKRPREPVGPKIPQTLSEALLPDCEPVDDGVNLSMAFGRLDLSGFEAEDVEYERCRFTKTVFAGTSLRRARLADVAFDGCDLANLGLQGSQLFNTALTQCRMTGVKLAECGLRDVLFDGCRANLSSYRFGRFKDVVFRDCDLSEANFQNAELSGVRFEGCKLVAAQFSGADMRGTRFADCDLYGVAGVQSFEGAIVNSSDAAGLVYALAAALGITIED